METFQLFLDLWDDIKLFLFELFRFIFKSLHLSFLRFESGKGVFVTALYRQRGKLSRKLTHSGMAMISVLGVMIAPVIAQEFPGDTVNPWELSNPPQVLSAVTDDPEIDTLISKKMRDSAITYTV